MARRRTPVPAPRGVWGLVARAQRIGLSEGFRGKGGGWLALGIGAWGLQRMRSAAGRQPDVLVREAVGPGETITITNLATTRSQAAAEAKGAAKDARAVRRRLVRDEKAAARAERRLPRRERRRLAAERVEAARATARAEAAAEVAAVEPRRRRRRSG